MTKKSLRDFEPTRVAHLETQMWEAYYHHEFLELLYLLVDLMRVHFGVGRVRGLRLALHAAFAAVDFRINKGKENHARLMKSLTRFYKIISDHTLEHFDYIRAAELELHWWLVDRYPLRYPMSRESALAEVMATLYGTDASKLNEYAQHRAEAMVLHDEAEARKIEADWTRIELLLNNSYVALKKAVQ